MLHKIRNAALVANLLLYVLLMTAGRGGDAFSAMCHVIGTNAGILVFAIGWLGALGGFLVVLCRVMELIFRPRNWSNLAL